MPLRARYSLYGLGSAPAGSVVPLWLRGELGSASIGSTMPVWARKYLCGLGDPLGVYIGNPLWVAHEVQSLMAWASAIVDKAFWAGT